jgi:hypothetical protein
MDLTSFYELIKKSKDSGNDVVNVVVILDRCVAPDCPQLTKPPHSVWSMIDDLCVKHGVQKMETVGKTYMACAGLHGTRQDHARACAELAEELIVRLVECRDASGEPLTARIGINTGASACGPANEPLGARG